MFLLITSKVTYIVFLLSKSIKYNKKYEYVITVITIIVQGHQTASTQIVNCHIPIINNTQSIIIDKEIPTITAFI